MFASMWSFLGWKEEEPVIQSYPPVTIVGARIPADGTPAHLLPLTTISDSSAPDSFLLHVPDLRSYWMSEQAWRLRDLHRFHLQKDGCVPLSQHCMQTDDFKSLLCMSQRLSREQILHLRQRYLLPQQRFFVQQHNTYHYCLGTYYVFCSFAVDDLPVNKFVPRWIEEDAHSPYRYFGDVFVVKISPDEVGQDGRAVYEDVDPLFLDFLVDDAACSKTLIPLLHRREGQKMIGSLNIF
ncbi:hypothetical protein M431DRAFT_506452 [Trichoderma harzianum CBS 226.95]|uniref:Uncharacterized protein n=1 Tax=Trichoderma harzianum CBS 226.95 TaxID=983964 RepID=A0A2T4AIF7_TRIHA|nr:hypothetical protein M431DRAFT_506452 [Trichoderma harzianum CBS 226.95]PTB56688.1 hypothetical protein M431DRAFT_506452 [Trichoderma harzianum CBS 226.95]